MVVIFEFLGTEPVENVITCMHYKVDKVVYFGYHEAIQSLKKSTDKFLDKYCGVTNTVYYPMPKDDLQSVLKSMRKEIEYELGQKNSIYFDITGGESLILVAFGILSAEYKTPMHHFDVRKNKLTELDEGAERTISKEVPAKETSFTLDSFIELRGGLINKSMHKGRKDIETDEAASDVERLWSVAQKYWDYWNPLSEFLRGNFNSEEELTIRASGGRIYNILAESKTKMRTPEVLNELLDALENAGVLFDVVHNKKEYRFTFKNDFVKDCLWDGGSILELYVYRCEKKNAPDCRVGVHIDWDGEINYPWGADVLNEIDVLTLQGNIPTFISCKSGKMEGAKALPALYELETVARRFGGKYAKKVLAVTRPLGEAYQARAEEMGIEVRVE